MSEPCGLASFLLMGDAGDGGASQRHLVEGDVPGGCHSCLLTEGLWRGH